MQERGSYIIAVIGSREGVGASSTSANLAIALLQETRQRTLLIDLDTAAAGDQFVMLGIRSGQPLVHLSKMRKIDPSLLKPFLVQHTSGISIATAILAREQEKALSASHIVEALQHLERDFPYIVIDCGSQINDLTSAVLEKASLILIVTNPDVLVVKRTKGVVEQLQSMLFPSEMKYIVLNKHHERSGFSPQMIQA
ncbi:MAG TPA: AAA family ATPase, partial [Bdellovibrionota bacterium]|nr:AAA family ATPase [Bdellovibrionota bacterium]